MTGHSISTSTAEWLHKKQTDVRRILAHVENNAKPLRDGKLSKI